MRAAALGWGPAQDLENPCLKPQIFGHFDHFSYWKKSILDHLVRSTGNAILTLFWPILSPPEPNFLASVKFAYLFPMPGFWTLWGPREGWGPTSCLWAEDLPRAGKPMPKPQILVILTTFDIFEKVDFCHLTQFEPSWAQPFPGKMCPFAPLLKGLLVGPWGDLNLTLFWPFWTPFEGPGRL